MENETGRESRYGRPFDYEHARHAGNVGDALKHVALWALAREWASSGPPLTVFDCHAGAGAYRLGPTGEWSAGVGRVFAAADPGWAPEPSAGPGTPAVVSAWLEALPARPVPGRGGPYLGSPCLVANALRPEDRMVFVELADAPRSALARRFAEDARAEIRGGDGLAALVAWAESGPARGVALLDPSYTRKAEWDEVGAAMAATHRAAPSVAQMLWYPVKSVARPHQLWARLQQAGVPATAVELVTGELGRRRGLAGSGLVLVHPPPDALRALVEALPWLGSALSPDGVYTATVRGWPARLPAQSEEGAPGGVEEE